MGKQQKAFKPGDYVFAKVKGYPAWPAKIVSLNGKKYNIYFYGTGESGNLPANDIFDYFVHKQQFLSKVLKRRDYNEGLAQIEVETTEAGLTSNGDKLNVTTDSAVDPDDSVNKTNITLETEADQTINTTVTEAEPPTPEPVKIPKKRASEANISLNQPPAKTRKIEEVIPEVEPEKELPAVEKDETPQPEPEDVPDVPAEKEPEEETEQENASEAVPSVPEPVKESTPAPAPVVSRGRKPSVKTPQPAQKSPRRAVKQEVMSPVYEPHIPAPESVSRSGRKIKPKRYLDEDAVDNANPQTPGKKIKIQPTTPTVAAPEEEEQITSPPMEVVENPPAETPSVPAVTPNDNPRKGRKKVIKNKALNFISKKELINIDISNVENGDLTHKDDVLAAVLPSGKIVGIKLFRDFPESFASPTAQEQWVTNMIKNAIQLKTDLECGQINPATITTQLEMEPPLSPDEIVTLKKDRDMEIRQRKLRLLKLECKLVGLEKEIKMALNLRHADVDRCIELLNQFLELEINRIMVLKQTGIMSLFYKICHYIGNESLWKLSEEEAAKFAEKADIIRKKSHDCLLKIMQVFDVKDEQSLENVVSELRLIFKMHTNKLNSQEYFELVDEPIEMLNAYKLLDVEKKKLNIQLSNNKHESKADIKSISKKTEASQQAVPTN